MEWKRKEHHLFFNAPGGLDCRRDNRTWVCGIFRFFFSFLFLPDFSCWDPVRHLSASLPLILFRSVEEGCQVLCTRRRKQIDSPVSRVKETERRDSQNLVHLFLFFLFISSSSLMLFSEAVNTSHTSGCVYGWYMTCTAPCSTIRMGRSGQRDVTNRPRKCEDPLPS